MTAYPSSQHDGKGIETADRDLGLSLRPGFRNRAPEDRVFGAPTIRTDIPGRDVKSVADNNNYGNEPDAMSLVYPSAAHRGVVDRDYIKPYDAGERVRILQAGGFVAEGRVNGDVQVQAVNAIVYANSSTQDEELRFTIHEANTKFILLAG